MDSTKENFNSYYYVLAMIAGILTAWVVAGTIGYMILGAVFGLLTAGLYLKVFVEKNEENF